MKKSMFLFLMGLFAFTLNADNKSVDYVETILISGCTATITVDCDGDGNYVLSNTVACEHVNALLDMYAEFCGD